MRGGDSLRIVVAGLAVTFPLGGVFWDYLQYAVGLARLGHDVLYLEDTGKWCYVPSAGTFVESAEANVARFAEWLKALDPAMADRWFVRDARDRTYGRAWESVAEFCRTADLFLHISASCVMRDEYLGARRVVFVDTDPVYTQAALLEPDERGQPRITWWKAHHDVFFTFAENIGAPDCRVPGAGLEWIPTRQPIVLDLFAPAMVAVEARRKTFTTVASWDPSDIGPIVDGARYGGKSREFERFIALPTRSPLPLELALSGRAPVDRLRAHGWRVVDGYSVSPDPWTYQQYLARSFGEWTVSKNAYVKSRSGWFSCRTACYLALGVPAVVEDTGFAPAIPTGRGLHTFDSLGEAADAIEQIATDPSAHADAARAIAFECFDAAAVLPRFLEAALDAPRVR